MKKIPALLSGMAFALVAQAQHPVPDAKPPEKKPVVQATDGKKEKFPPSKEPAFDQNTQNQLDQTRYLLYHPGKRPGC